MRFLLCNRDCQISGGTTYLLMLAEGLLAAGHNVTLAAGAGMVAERFDQLGVRRLFTVGGPLSSWVVHREAARNRPDAVVYSSRGSARDLAASVVRSTGAVGVCVLQDHVKSGGEAAALCEADVAVALERPIYDQAIAAGAPAERLHCWPRPVMRASRVDPNGAEPNRLLWMGRMSGNKSWSAFTLIEALPAIANRIPGVEVSIVGSGSRARRIRQAARDMNQQLGRDAIEVRPATNNPLADIRRATLVIGGGYTCLEALYNGRPAIASGFEWLGPVTRDRIADAYDQHFGDRSAGRTDAAGIADAVCEVHQASAAGGLHRFQPRPDWFPVDHTTLGHAEMLGDAVEAIAAPAALCLA
ncbi:hypothetical protein KOR34_33710 [Posidoniimonas corsicana]|uniref:Glycosyltransferase subfamily 4-like N-terminal domain-containing protein n=1 Tax=Posidoniimonas corsicana TaxID=1938618 RepID=A0A5C5V6K7_9BACT|nr:glycosyltransferase family 4 protein [Posidoniimonas corsicana]TWT33539.1 hypothetical protein KOR34_33710 [Posidoniimonas corsicana]